MVKLYDASFDTNGNYLIDSCGDVGFNDSICFVGGYNICCIDRITGVDGYMDFSNAGDELILSGTSGIRVQGYLLPTADGSIGQVMCTNGSGTLGWGTGGAAALWVDGSAPYIVACNSCGVCVPAGKFTSKMVLPVGTNCY